MDSYFFVNWALRDQILAGVGRNYKKIQYIHLWITSKDGGCG